MSVDNTSRYYQVLAGQTPVKQGIFDVKDSPEMPVGSVIRLLDGRTFMYAKAGEDLVAGWLCMGSGNVHANIAVAAAASVGDKEVTVTSAGAIASNELANGFLTVVDGDGQGYSYKIESNTAATASGQSVTVKLEDPLREALTTSSEVQLISPPTMNVQRAETTLTDIVVGVAPIDVSSGEYFWLQTCGVCAVLRGGSVAVGQLVVAGGAAGGVTAYDEDGTTNLPIVGRAVGAVQTTSSDHQPVYLTIFP